MAESRSLNIMFISSTHKGDDMMRTMKAAGCRILVISEEERRNEPWPYDVIDEIFFMPDLRRYQDVTNAVTYLARGQIIDQLIPLDEFEVELVAILREHLRLPGMNVSAVRAFRDKLAMRQITREDGIKVPDFIQVLNYDRLREFMGRVPTPWMLKPRMEAGSMGLKKVHDSEQVWRTLDELGDRQSYYLVEQFVPGDVYHVDSLTVGGKVKFTSVQKYGAPPIDIYQGGGVFMTGIVQRDSEDDKALRTLNEQVIKTLGMVNGVTHAEYIKAHADGQFYFLEVAARVGGAFIADMIAAATGINLWSEWGKLELSMLRGEKYALPKPREDYAGLLLTLARQEHPDLSGYNDPEIVWRVDKPRHAGLILKSADHGRIQELLRNYHPRFLQDFSTSAAPMDASRTGYTG